MMATLTFNLPEDTYEFRAALDGSRAISVLEELRVILRNKRKYEQLSTGAVELLDNLWDSFHELAGDLLRD